MSEHFQYNNSAYKIEPIPVAAYFANCLEEDGYYHLSVADLLESGYFTDTSVFYQFDVPVALTGNIPPHTKILSSVKLDEEAQSHSFNLKITGTADNPAIIGDGAIVKADGIKLEHVSIGKKSEIQSVHGPMRIENSEGSQPCDIKCLHGPLVIENCYFNGLVESVQKPLRIHNSHIKGKIESVGGAITIENSHIDGEVCCTHKNIILNNCTRSSTTEFKLIHGTLVGSAVIAPPKLDLPMLVKPSQPEKLPTAQKPLPGAQDPIIASLNALSGAKALWIKTRMDGKDVYKTQKPIKNPQGVVLHLMECLDCTIPMPAKGEGKVTIPADVLTIKNHHKLGKLAIAEFLAPVTMAASR